MSECGCAKPLVARQLPEALPTPYAAPPLAHAVKPHPETLNLVRSQVQALLMATPAFKRLSPPVRRRLAHGMVKVAAYAAELVRDDWYQSKRLGQRPLVRTKEITPVRVMRAQNAGQNFKAGAASQIGRVTKETLNAISFPTFVADLIRGTFNAITQANIQQMESYNQLLSNVGKTVDQFMNDNISDNQARDYLAQMYPDHVVVKNGQAIARENTEGKLLPNFKEDLGLSDSINWDDETIEAMLVPAARRKLSQTRLQLLSTMVLMGMNRIVVTHGKIRATLGFHIDTSDKLQEEHASDLDVRVAASGSFGFGPWQASVSTSVAYVTSSREKSETEMNVAADLTSEVELNFKSDYFPLTRFADSRYIDKIKNNTAVPEANEPESTEALKKVA
jgi:hypothetical protein